MSTSMSFAQSYILALKVRSKLTKQATDPKTSLRALVTQANMLDNLMDHISAETAKRNKKMNTVVVEESQDSEVETRGRHVTISLPSREQNTSIAEYEVDSDLDSDLDSELDSDYYYSSEEDEDEDYEDEDEDLLQLTNLRRTSQESGLSSHYSNNSSTINLLTPNTDRANNNLSVILEELDSDESDEDIATEEDLASHEHEVEVPGLCRSQSLTDEEDFEQHHYAIETGTREHYQPRLMEVKDITINQGHVHFHDDVHSHHRHNAMITVSDMF